MLVFERGNHLTEDVDGVGCGPAVESAVQVAVGTRDFHLHVAQAAQSRRDGRHVVGDHPRVTDEHHVGRQTGLVGFEEILEVNRANLFFPLNHELDVARHLVGRDHGLKGLHMHEELTLVVARATRKNRAVGVEFGLLDHRLKRRAIPQINGIGWLHVVVTVHQHSRQRGVN